MYIKNKQLTNQATTNSDDRKTPKLGEAMQTKGLQLKCLGQYQ